MELILISLAAMKATEFLKELIPFPIDPWMKSVLSLVFAVLFGLVVEAEALVIAGAWGGAALAHEIRAVLSMISDDKKQQIMLRAPAPRRYGR